MDKDPRFITVRRSTVVRAGVVALVVVALGVGIAVGLLVGSKSSPPAKSTASDTTTSRPSTTTTSAPGTTTTTTTTTAVPVVLSCGPGSTQHVQPATLTVGCAAGTTTVTGITWSAWASASGGQGTGTLNVGLLSAPAIVVVFHVVDGVFQDVSITPTKDLSSSSTTTSTTSKTALSSTTTTTTAGVRPVAASQPGTGWGGK